MRKMKKERTNHAVSCEHLEKVSPPVSLDELMNEFILTKKAERSAERTINDYLTHFRYFRTWLDNHYPNIKFREITQKTLLEYITFMTNEKLQYDDHSSHQHRSKRGIVGLSPMTVNVRIRTLKAFFNWCHRNGHTKTNLAEGIKLQKVDNDRIMAFTLEQVQKLLSIPDQKTYAGFRDFVLMMCLLDTGLRCSELLSLTVDDINFEELTLTVPWDKAKTRKTRTVPISKKVAKLLAELIQENKDFGSNANKLFYSAFGNELTVEAVDEKLREYGKKAGLDGVVRCSPHTFRHTFAVFWIKSGGDPFSLQSILGHTDMSMVRRYVRLTQGDVKLKHNQYSPINQLSKGRTSN